MNPLALFLRVAGRRNPRLLMYLTLASFVWRVMKRAANGPSTSLVFEVQAGERYEIRGIRPRR